MWRNILYGRREFKGCADNYHGERGVQYIGAGIVVCVACGTELQMPESVTFVTSAEVQIEELERLARL